MQINTHYYRTWRFNYSKYEEPSFKQEQQYADDIGKASTSEHVLENIEKKLSQRKTTETGKSTNKSIEN